MAPNIPLGARVTSFTRDVVNRIAGGMTFFSGAAQLPPAPVPIAVRRDPWFGPGDAQRPVAPRQDVAGRAYDYQNTINLNIAPRAYEGVSFEMLEALSVGSDTVRLAIETRKDQMSKLTWSVLPKMQVGQELRGPSDARCQMVEDALRYPDKRLPWHSWQRMLIEEQLVTDAATIYVRPDNAGRPYAFEVIAGKTIVPKLDLSGRTPMAPDVAYQQVLKGMPAVDYTSDELIYAPRNPRPGKLYGMCYSADTQVLTRRGWLLFSEVKLSDEIATRNPATKAFEWQQPSRLVAEPYAGDMFHFSSKNVDLLVTPEHRMLLDSMPKAANGGNKRTRVGGEVIISARELALGHNHMNKIPMTSTWLGVEVQAKEFALPEPVGMIEITRLRANGHVETFQRRRHRGNEQITKISGDDYCALMGAYLAEGNLRSAGGIEIAQQSFSKGFKAYGQLVSRIFGGPAQHNGCAFVLPRRGLTEHFSQFGLAHEKTIPDEIMNAPVRQLRLFWDHYVLGDGHFEKRPNVTGRGRAGEPSPRITTVSARMADQLVEVAQKLGWSASLRRRVGGPGLINGRSFNRRDIYIISVRYSKAHGFKTNRTTYHGTVHCVTVPNGIVYVRRNGKPAWCGNSPVEQIIMTVNIAIRREIVKLSYYTEGNVPEALISVPQDWPPDKIKAWQDIWDTMMADQTRRQRAKFVPGGMVYQQTRNDQSLQSDFDEWLARVVMFAFSLPALPFVKMQNRATAETSYETALEEGLQPMMVWFKSIMDRIVQASFGFADLEFVWDDIDEVDPAEQQTRDLQMINVGAKSVDEMRAGMGLPPIGMKHAVWGIGPLGFMFVDDLLQAHADGLLKIQPPAPPPVIDPNTGMPVAQAPPGSPGFVDGGNSAPSMTAPQPGGQSPALAALAGVSPRLLAAVGLGPQGPAGRSVDVTDDEETSSDPLLPHAAHPEVLKTLRDAERSQKGRGQR